MKYFKTFYLAFAFFYSHLQAPQATRLAATLSPTYAAFTAPMRLI